MVRPFDLLLRGGTVVNQDGEGVRDIGVVGETIAEVGALGRADAAEIIDCRGLHILPGVMDTQVHLREPGLTHKEDFETGGRAALLGGVTAVFEMPNTNPATTTESAVADKLARARGRMACDHAFYVGATADNAEILKRLELLPGVCGVKMFMGSSTGDLLVPDDESVLAVLQNGRRRVAVHSEDEAILRASKAKARAGDWTSHPEARPVEAAVSSTRRLLQLARKARRRVHVLHVSTAEELVLLGAAKDIATVETTPQHLTLTAPECYESLKGLAQMNPPIRDARHRDALWAGVNQGIVDVLGSDHAPHTIEEKAREYPGSPSGMPGVQHILPVMLDHVAQGRLTLMRLVDLLCHGPKRVFGIVGKGRIAAGYDADFSIVDMKARRLIRHQDAASRCRWTPFDGMTVAGWPKGAIIRGRRVMWEGEILGPAAGAPLRFEETL
jgi:dihydroorotase